MRTGEWLNGRAAVSKTVGCVFESRLPCHKKEETFGFLLFCGRGIVMSTRYNETYCYISNYVCRRFSICETLAADNL